MVKYFTTNGRVVSELLASYRNTFYAMLELINNSIQAKATKIEVNIEKYEDDILSPVPFISISIKDNGDGVHIDDIGSKLFDIGTSEKKSGLGIGRFAAFQIGRTMKIETVGIKDGKKSKSSFTVNADKIKELSTNNCPVDIDTKDTDENSYYNVYIEDLYSKEDIDENPKRKICKELLLENIYEQIFLQYSDTIINSKVQFIINGKEIFIEDFTVGEVEKSSFRFKTEEGENEVKLTVLHYKAKKPKITIDYRINNNGIYQQVFEEKFNFDIPDDNGWRFFVDSDCIQMTDGIYRNLAINELDEDVSRFKEKTKNEVEKYFKEKFADYYNFSQKLKNDEYYPYREKAENSKSQAIIFNQFAYCLENEYELIAKKIICARSFTP